MNQKVEDSLESLKKAFARLQEALTANPLQNSLAMDATIQRFEFVYELLWKTLRRVLEDQGMESKTPKETFKKCYSIGWIENEGLWLKMIEDRNLTSHTYDQATAERVYADLASFVIEIKKVIDRIEALRK